jgi:hypothetical protein
MESATIVARGKYEVLVHKPLHSHGVGFLVLNNPLEKFCWGHRKP